MRRGWIFRKCGDPDTAPNTRLLITNMDSPSLEEIPNVEFVGFRKGCEKGYKVLIKGTTVVSFRGLVDAQRCCIQLARCAVQRGKHRASDDRTSSSKAAQGSLANHFSQLGSQSISRPRTKTTAQLQHQDNHANNNGSNKNKINNTTNNNNSSLN